MDKKIINAGLLIVVSLVFVQCWTESKIKTKDILVELFPDRLILEQRQIEKNDFEKELKLVINKKIEEGFKRDELTIVLKVDENTRRGDIADLETAMRRLNVRKVTYSVFGRKQTSATSNINHMRVHFVIKASISSFIQQRLAVTCSLSRIRFIF
jgi:hypothetical protein